MSVLCAFDGGQFETMVENVAQAARRQAGHNEIKKNTFSSKMWVFRYIACQPRQEMSSEYNVKMVLYTIWFVRKRSKGVSRILALVCAHVRSSCPLVSIVAIEIEVFGSICAPN